MYEVNAYMLHMPQVTETSAAVIPDLPKDAKVMDQIKHS